MPRVALYGGGAGGDTVAKLPRYMRDKEALRALLVGPPIAAHKPPKDPKAAKKYWRAVKQQEAERLEALFALYDIPEDWDPLTQWYWLGRALAAERYQGLRIVLRPPGGPKGAKREKAYDLFREFEAYALARPKLNKRSAAARSFVGSHRKECAATGFTDWRSFAQAAAGFSAKYPAEDMMPASEQRRRGPPTNRLLKKTQ